MVAALFTHKKMCCHHPLKHLVHGGFSRVGGSSGSNIYKTPEKEGLLVFVLNLNSETRDLQLVMQGPRRFQIGHVVQIKLETGVELSFRKPVRHTLGLPKWSE